MGPIINHLRAISRLTQPEFARHRRIALGTLQQLERGDADPKLSTLNKIGEIFGLEVGFVKKAVPKPPCDSQP